MKDHARCGVCLAEQYGSSVQKIVPVVTVATGIAIYRCSEHLNVPAKEGEGEPYHA
jgi:hypothetical protein